MVTRAMPEKAYAEQWEMVSSKGYCAFLDLTYRFRNGLRKKEWRMPRSVNV